MTSTHSVHCNQPADAVSGAYLGENGKFTAAVSSLLASMYVQRQSLFDGGTVRFWCIEGAA
jgi:hypothetical protein